MTRVLFSAQFSLARCCLRSCPARRWRHFDSRQCEPHKFFLDIQADDAQKAVVKSQVISVKCSDFGLKCHILQLLQPLATSKAWAHSGFSVSRQLAGEHLRLMSMFCNPHKAWISYRFHDQLLFQSSTSSLRTAGDRGAVSWRSSPNVQRSHCGECQVLNRDI